MPGITPLVFDQLNALRLGQAGERAPPFDEGCEVATLARVDGELRVKSLPSFTSFDRGDSNELYWASHLHRINPARAHEYS